MDLTGMRHHDDDTVVDVVVVGTGAGGAPLLAVLARAGLKVVALEAGRNVASEEFVADETEATHINWMEERLSGGENPTAFGPNNSGQGVGGSTLHWGAFAPRPDHDDLRLRSTTGSGEDWPFDLAELRPYLERTEHDIGVAGPTPYPWDPGRRYRWRPPRRNTAAELMARGCEALGVRWADAPSAVLPATQQDGRGGCVACGLCHQGCRTGAKASTDVVHLPQAVAAGAEIRPEARVVGIDLDATGRVSAVVYVRDGVERRQRCANLVLAAGGVETARLLLHTGLANSSGQVGRNFMAHGATQVWGRFDAGLRSHRGYPSSLITEDFRRPSDAFAGGYLIQSLGVMPLTFATGLVRGAGLWGRELVDALRDYPRLAGVGINAECLPSDDSVLTLSDESDTFGIPKAVVQFSAGPNEQALRAHAVSTMTHILEAAGAESTRMVERTAHTVGTCRMGSDPDRAVVDADGRSFDVPNLWICDSSVFPSSLIANPALTVMAVSLRTADKFLGAR